ncbi:hypothetical protein ABFS83_04G066700 [Erythranthe nasuta]
MAARRGGMMTVVVVVVAVAVVMMSQQYAVEGLKQGVEVCLMSCGQKAMTCASECGGKFSCYQSCGNTDIGCVTSCLGPTPAPPPHPQGNHMFRRLIN